MDFGYTYDMLPYEQRCEYDKIHHPEKAKETSMSEKTKGNRFDEAKQVIRNLKKEDEIKNREARRTVEFIRPEILEFAEAMELTMRKHDGNKGDSWKTCDLTNLFIKFDEENEEAHNEVYKTFCKGDSSNLKPELVDLCNVCMMLWNRKEIE